MSNTLGLTRKLLFLPFPDGLRAWRSIPYVALLIYLSNQRNIKPPKNFQILSFIYYWFYHTYKNIIIQYQILQIPCRPSHNMSQYSLSTSGTTSQNISMKPTPIPTIIVIGKKRTESTHIIPSASLTN